MSYSPRTGLVYIPAKQEPLVYFLDEAYERRDLGVNLGLNLWDPEPTEYTLGQEFQPEIQGHLIAWDPIRQQEVWRAPQPGSHNGGLLSTAGNLVFQGNADGELVAYRDGTGEVLWRADVQSGVTAPPVTFAVDGEQYVAVLAGWGSSSALIMGPDLNPDGRRRNLSRVLAFKLGADATLPEPPPLVAAAPPPAEFGDETMVEAGRVLYAKNCTGCHGLDAVSGGVLPDLRHSALIADGESFAAVVLGGSLADKGMVSFAANLDPDDTEAVRAFIVRKAHEGQ